MFQQAGMHSVQRGQQGLASEVLGRIIIMNPAQRIRIYFANPRLGNGPQIGVSVSYTREGDNGAV
jgi:hypothetical protein